VSVTAKAYSTRAEDRMLSLALLKSRDLVDPKDVGELLKLAIKTSPANREAWEAMADRCGKADVAGMERKRALDMIENFALGKYDEFALHLLLRMAEGLGPRERKNALDHTAQVFAKRQDLLAQVRLAQGDLARDNDQPAQAADIYRRMIRENPENGPAIIDALSRLEDTAQDTGDWIELAKTFRQVWPTMKKPDEPSGYAWTTPWFIIGTHYAGVLEKAGDKPEAKRVRDAVKAMDTAEVKKWP
jgi:hypothetical protein